MKQLHFSAILCSLLHSIAFLSLTLAAVDEGRLFPNQTLVPGQTLVSQNQVFEMGFFSPGKSLNRFMGIWYKSTPEVIVWVANRNNPIPHSQAPVFVITRSGSLVISSGKGMIWSANSSRMATNPVLQLLDSGNLVLVDNTVKEGCLWQSFDNPTDTLLPGTALVDDEDAGVEKYLTSWRNPDDPSPGDFVLKIHNHGLPDLVVFKGPTKRYRQGQWNGVYFSGGTPFPNDFYKPELVIKKERLISIGEHYQSSHLTRVTIDSFGTLVRHHMNTRISNWSLAYTFPRDTCDEYASCAPNSICRSERPIRCQCFRGFTPKFRSDWDLQDWSGGCVRMKPLNCEGGDGFVEVRGVKYPDMSSFWLNTTMNLGECRYECLKNCNCTAYANPFITDGGSGCLMWFGELIDTKELSEGDSKQNIYIRIPLSELDINTGLEEVEEETKRPNKLILVSIASGVLVSAIINGGLLFMARQKGQEVKMKNGDVELPVINKKAIVQATNNFSEESMIGVGGFGPVYKGKMPSGEEIAVKRLSRSSRQGLEEFRNEVMVIAKLQHRNLVRLLGCCIEKEERMLIYEYLENKSLDYFVFENRQMLLTWPERYEIIMGISRGLLYLHHDSRLKIIHRDLKTSNILLDKNLNPKISDFGLARIFEEDQSLAKTKRIVGTYGYMAPEYAIDGKFSVKSDIFSLGVVMLELISGKKNRGYGDSNCYLNLLGHAWMLWQENKILELMDECLNDTFTESQVKRCMQVGLLCVQKFAEDRPTMSSVVSMLGTDGAFLPRPKEPGFFNERSSSFEQSSSSPSLKSENEITITDLEAR